MRGVQGGSHAIAWAATLTSSSSGFLRPSAIEVDKVSPRFCIQEPADRTVWPSNHRNAYEKVFFGRSSNNGLELHWLCSVT